MSNLYKSNWWSTELPEGWKGSQEADCHTFVNAENPVGAFQVSAHKKGERLITDADVVYFLDDEIKNKEVLEPVQAKNFKGYHLCYEKDDVYWEKWWLYAGSLLIFATYNCSKSKKGFEWEAVKQVINTLQPG